MNFWPFILFALIFAALVYAHFFLAYRSWRISRWEEATDIDQKYVRLEDYPARSFRSKVSKWLTLPEQESDPRGTKRIRKGNENILVSNTAEYLPQSRSDDILIVREFFKCLAGCTFNREIYVKGDAQIGAGTNLQAIAVDGNLTLGHNVQIARWADSQGNMKIDKNSIVRDRVTAGRTIQLARGVRARTVFAAAIRTGANRTTEQERKEIPLAPKLELPPLETSEKQAAARQSDQFDLKKLRKAGRDSWIYYGDLELSESFHLRASLVVRGNCVVPPGSVIDHDLKGKQSISIGRDSVCRGNIIADENISLGRSCRFYGIVHAGRALRLSGGVTGGDAGSKAVVFAEDVLEVEENVVVYGKLASDVYVEVVPETGRDS